MYAFIILERSCLMIHLENLITESRNTSTKNIDKVSTLELVKIINEEDKKVALAIEQALPQIAAAIDKITDSLKSGGRLFYIGAGTSGRIGILDASECPPTYGTDPNLVQGLIAGGIEAIFRSQEGAEDSFDLGAADLKEKNLNDKDVVVGLAASGRTPYVLGGLDFAKANGAATISVTCNPDSPLAKAAAIPIIAAVGPEVITGSTRMKAGTAQKMILNMLSTGAMIHLGKVYGNLMIDVKASNKKLEERACHIVQEATGCSRSDAQAALGKSKGQAKLAIFMVLSGLSIEISQKILEENKGFLAQALTSLHQQPPTKEAARS